MCSPDKNECSDREAFLASHVDSNGDPEAEWIKSIREILIA